MTVSGHDDKNEGELKNGGMAEWSKAAVLKTVEGNTSVGSNPTPSAIQSTNHGEMAELAEGTRLLSEYGAKVPSRVRIPVSPPSVITPGFHTRVFNSPVAKSANNMKSVNKTLRRIV